MFEFNKAMISGRITKDLELKHTPNNIPVVTFTIAVNRKTKAGEEKIADFLEVVAWRNTAEFICSWFKKGSGIFIEGEIQTRTWTDSEGKNRKAVEIVAKEVHFAESKVKLESPNIAKNLLENAEEITDENDDSLPF